MHIFKRREEWILAGLSAVFLMLIAVAFVWGINLLIKNFDAAFGNNNASPSAANFKIDGAKEILETRGFPE